MVTEIKAGALVMSTKGYFTHIARSESRTVCGKDIARLFPGRQDGSPECKVCQRATQ